MRNATTRRSAPQQARPNAYHVQHCYRQDVALGRFQSGNKDIDPQTEPPFDAVGKWKRVQALSAWECTARRLYGLASLGLHPVCSGSQQTLGLLALGKPDTQNLSYAYAPYRTTQVRRRIDDLFRTR